MHISEAGGRTIATDLSNVFGSFDAAILDAARLTTSVMETNEAAHGITPAQSQRFMDALADSFSKAVEGRRSMIAAQRTLITLKGQSNLDVVDFGCLTVEASSTPAKQVVSAN